MRYLLRGFLTDKQIKMFDAFESDPDNTIVLDIHCQGGDCGTLAYGIGVIQKMRRKGKKIVTVNSGVAFSAAATLLTLGDEVYLTDCCATTYHETQSDLWEDIKDKALRILKGHHRADPYDVLEVALSSYEPWDGILKMFGDKRRRGDYTLLASEMCRLLDTCKLQDLPEEYENLTLWTPDEEFDGEISPEEAGLTQDELEDIVKQGLEGAGNGC